jgi:hypothetical protein
MIKIGAKAIRHARSIILQVAEVALTRDLWTGRSMDHITGRYGKGERKTIMARGASVTCGIKEA